MFIVLERNKGMKKVLALAFAVAVGLTLVGCISSDDEAADGSVAESEVPLPEGESVAVGVPDDLEPLAPEGGQAINDFTYFFQTYQGQSDPGENLTALEGAIVAWDEVIEPTSIGTKLLPNEIIYISFDDIDTSDNGDRYLYSVGVGSVDSGFEGEGYHVVFKVAVEVETSTATMLEDLSDSRD